MNKSVLLTILAAAALTVGLYTRPKVVVRNADKQLAGNVASQTPESKQHSAISPAGNGEAVHEKVLSSEQQKRLTTLKAEFDAASASQKEVVGAKLIALLQETTRYDSAAHYAKELVNAQPTERNLLRAGDAYFEAYTFAVDEQKTARLGQQTRDFYGQALAKNPNLLSAKANMAMTYVSTETPMQGIKLLREVIDQDPTNELALFNLGLLAMRSNQYERAVERFRQILVNNPSSRKARFYLGVSLAEAGQKAEAKQILAQVKQQEKDPQILAAVREYEERLAN